MTSDAGLHRIAGMQVGELCGFTAQPQALGRLKRVTSSRLRNTSGASPCEQRMSSGAVQPDHFAAALEKLQGAQGPAQGMGGRQASRGGAAPTVGDAPCTHATGAAH